MLDLKSRVNGLALLLASAGGALIHRSIYEAPRSGSAQPAEFALGLLTLLLASTGILMLIHGDKLFERQLDRLEPRSPTSKADALDMVGPPLPADSDFNRRRGVIGAAKHGEEPEAGVGSPVTVRD